MKQVTVFSVRLQEIEHKLLEVHAQHVATLDTIIQQFDISGNSPFIPPIYHSPRFVELFNFLTNISRQRKTLHEQGIGLFVLQQPMKDELIVKDEAHNTVLYRIILDQKQYENILRVFPAAGMHEVACFRKNNTIYHYETLHSVYSLFRWTRVPAFMLVQSIKEADLVEALALLGISMNKTIDMSLKEIEKYYQIPNLSTY